MNNRDLQGQLFLAAAAAAKFVDSIAEESPNYFINLKEILRKRISEQVQFALEGVIPVEDGIFHLNQISGKEKAVGEPKFDYNPTCGSLPEMEGIF